jgi:hypothetical protein
VKNKYHVGDRIRLVGDYRAMWMGRITVPEGTEGEVTNVMEKGIQARMDCKRRPMITLYSLDSKGIPDLATTSEQLVEKIKK